NNRSASTDVGHQYPNLSFQLSNTISISRNYLSNHVGCPSTNKNNHIHNHINSPNHVGSPSTNKNNHMLSISQSDLACRVCRRTFTTKTGVGVHMSRAHPNEHDVAKIRIDIKSRWSEEEEALLAKKEAELTTAGVKFLNKALAPLFPSRSLEAIKKARQKASYRQRVEKYIELIAESDQDRDKVLPESDIRNPPSPLDNVETSEAICEDIRLRELMAMTINDNESFRTNELKLLIRNAPVCGKAETLIGLLNYIEKILPIRTQMGHSIKTTNRNEREKSRRKRRRQEYARTQRNWHKHQGRCIKEILDGPTDTIKPPEHIMVPFWRTIMENDCSSSPILDQQPQNLEGIWSQISPIEIERARLEKKTSPGLDGISSGQLRAIPADILSVVFNIIMWCGKMPNRFCKTKTIFIPKKSLAKDPGDFRPITIPSVIVRQLHSIIAKRIAMVLKLDPRQRAFQPTDGTGDNAVLLDIILRSIKAKFHCCYMASLDVSKAFDSVSHNTIIGALRSCGFPEEFVLYLEEFYKSANTVLLGDGWASSVKPKRGVKQGDPLSPIIFNIIIDKLLKMLPNEVGVRVGDSSFNSLAFADDLILFASTPSGLQLLLDTTNEFLKQCGLCLNTAKCITISIKGQPKQKNSVVESRKFKVEQTNIPALKRTDEWKYLGISFTADGRCKIEPQNDILPKLLRLTKAALKPQQRLHALRTVLIPQLYHKITLGNVRISCLNKLDKTIRSYVRRWLALPHDITTAFYHAPITGGGLGIPCMRWYAPLIRQNRLKSVTLPNNTGVKEINDFISKEIRITELRLQNRENNLSSLADIDCYFNRRLYNSVDGAGLREAGNHIQAHRWLREPTRMLSGKDFIECIRVRINALPSRSRTTRGRSNINRMCRAGCQVPETSYHTIQVCHRTSAARIERHNSVAKYVTKKLKEKGYTVLEEKHLKTSEGLRKPDILALKNNEAIILDAQVVSDSTSLDIAHRRKKAYYNTVGVKNQINTELQHNVTTVSTIILSWRGIWSKESINDLIKLKILNKSDSAPISTRALIGSTRCFRIFNNSTTYRQGIG
uniref:Reverse transcriptase domain-containing protein n=1 Tax=Glossina brevipalpis TaxID=37001 RepID=A0A1A9VZG3_9MUSC